MFVLVVKTDGETMYVNPRFVVAVEPGQNSTAVLRMDGGESFHIRGPVQGFIEKVSALFGREEPTARR
jgi:hypothetical protein